MHIPFLIFMNLFCVFHGILAFLVFGVSELAVAKEPLPSFIVITVDTLRADRLSIDHKHSKGAKKDSLHLLERGAVFKNAFSTSSCTIPSHASIMTGLYPSLNSAGALNNGRLTTDGAPTFAELFLQHGYKTAAIVSNPILSEVSGMSRGFSLYDDEFPFRVPTGSMVKTADMVVERALRFISNSEGKPFLLWLHFQDPHGPYLQRSSIVKSLSNTSSVSKHKTLSLGQDNSGYRSIPLYQFIEGQFKVEDYIKSYKSEIQYAVHHIHSLLGALEEKKYFQNNYLLLTADHGEAFGEDDYYFAHSHSLGIDQVHVPFVVVGKEIKPETYSCEASGVDIFPTLVELAGFTVNIQTSGVSLVSQLRGAECEPARIVYTESFNQRGVATAGSYFYQDIYPDTDKSFWSQPNPNTGARVFPLGSNLVEVSTYKSSEIDVKERQKFAALMQSTKAPWNHDSKPQTELAPRLKEELQKLRSLGYAG